MMAIIGADEASMPSMQADEAHGARCAAGHARDNRTVRCRARVRRAIRRIIIDEDQFPTFGPKARLDSAQQLPDVPASLKVGMTIESLTVSIKPGTAFRGQAADCRPVRLSGSSGAYVVTLRSGLK